MRRSLAPSQRSKLLENKVNDTGSSAASASSTTAPADGEVTIQRLPLFGFLEIPKALSRQFKIPSGCLLTKKSIALRKIKRLGPSKNFHIVRPGDYANALVKHTGLSPDENGDGDNEEEDLPTASTNLPPFEPLVLWSHPEDADNKVEVIPQLACKLRPHQREGVQFLFECTMGLRGFEGEGCILADDMGLGKTLMSITLLWTLLNQGFSKAPGSSAVRKIVVVCPTSLVGNWDNEIRKWVGEHCPTFAVKTDPKKMIKTFLQHRGKGVLIVSYETQRLYSKLFEAAAKPSILNKSTAPASDSAAGAGASAFEQAAHGPGVDTTTTDPVRLLRAHSNNNVCDLLICDEAHKLKNADSGLAKSLNLLPARKRILLSGTPMQNELTEFYNMVNFCNPMVLGTNSDFKRRYERPILASREPDATEKQTAEAGRLQKELSTIVNEFILKRGNILNAQHLPPKLVQFVCCRLTPLQETLYNHLLNSKEIRHAREGKQLDTLGAIRQLINICSHPKLLVDTYNAKRACNEPVSEELVELVNIIKSYNSTNSTSGTSSSGGLSSSGAGAGGGSALGPSKPSAGTLTSGFTRMGVNNPGKVAEMRNFSLKKGLGSSSSGNAADRVDPELSGKMGVLCRMMQTMRASKQPGQQGERIVVVSNYTQTLDLIQQVCVQSNWPVLRLDGSISANKRTKLVDDFNNPASGAFVFLLSSKAGGCGINLIGGSRLVLFDPDWNPASDKQAAARIWREGQKRRCFIYRFMSTGSIEEKIIQRQLSKEGLADIVDDKEQVNQFSSDELRDLFSLRQDTASDTHDTLRCKRCNSVKVREASKKGGKTVTFTPAQADACVQFLDEFALHLQKEAAAHIVRQSKNGAAAPVAVNSSSPESIVLPFAPEIEALKESLRTNGFASLPVYSKAQREVMQGIDDTLQQARAHKPAPPAAPAVDDSGAVTEAGAAQSEEDRAEAEMIAFYKALFPSSFSIFAEFLNRWVEAVPALTLLGKTTAKSSSTSNLSSAVATDGDGGDAGPDAEESFEGEFVEQEGCPDDTDFNRWSHHCGVNSCDDELLSRALADDNTVSFVFGLEVNWSLLESREALLREENEVRKEQQRLDLEALNEQRRLKREQLAAPKASKAGSDSDGDGDGGDGDAVNPTLDKSDQPGKKKSAKKPPTEKKPKRPLDDADGAGDPPSKVPKSTVSKKSALVPPIPPSVISAVSSPGPSAPTSSRRGTHIALVDPLHEIDETFRADWEYLRRTHSKGKLDLADFTRVLKQLKQFNNNWRVVPADYRDSSVEIMWTRMPGLKKETCSQYRSGFDFFPTEAQLKQFICAQASLLGDGELVEGLQSEVESPPVERDVQQQSSAQQGSPAQAEQIAQPATKGRSPAGKPPKAASKRQRIQSDSESDVEVVAESAKKRKITAPLAPRGVTTEDINFSDTSDDSDQGGAAAARSIVPHKAPGMVQAPPGPCASVRANRRVIADDEEDATPFLPAVSVQQTAQAPLSSSKPKLVKKSTPAKPPKPASSVPVFDLTTQPTLEHAPSSALKSKPRSGQKENTHPNPAGGSSSSSGKGRKVSDMVQGCSQHTADSQDSAAEAEDDKDHSLGHSSRSGSDGSGGGSLNNNHTDGSVTGSSQEWICSFCTLENNVITDPTECSICGNRRSFNTRPKRAVASQISQIY